MKRFSLISLIILIVFLSCETMPYAAEEKLLVMEVKPEQELETEIVLETELFYETEEILLAEEEPIIDTSILLAEADERLAEMEQQLAGMEQLLAEMERRLADIEIAAEEPSALPVVTTPIQTPPPAVTPAVPPAVTPASPPASPPAIPQVPPTAAPPPVPIPVPLPAEIIEETAETNEPTHTGFSRNDQSVPAARIDNLTQMGITPLDTEIVYSRIVRATVGQVLEIPFRGTGWVYLGEIASRRGIVYSSRRNDAEGLSFIFALEAAGTYTLKFYRQDFIRDYILNDHVQVIVGEAPAAGAGWFNAPVDRGRVVAQPRWPSPLEEAQIRSGVMPSGEPVVSGTPAPNAATPSQERAPAQTASAPQAQQLPVTQPQTVISPSAADASQAAASQAAASNAVVSNAATSELTAQNEEVSMPRLTPEVIIQRAQESFDAGNVSSAISLLNQYMEYYPGGSDEIYWLYGQFYEANSPSRNILLSLDYYRRLTNEYPQSRRFNEARRRIAYLERFYINIQ